MKKAVIVAAGMGTRLKDRTKHMPKGFLEIEGVSLIERSILKLLDVGVEKIIIGTGYLSEFFERLSDIYPIECVKSPRFATTGSMYTLHNLREHIQEDFILLESDLLYDRSGLQQLINDKRPDVILASDKTFSGDEVLKGIITYELSRYDKNLLEIYYKDVIEYCKEYKKLCNKNLKVLEKIKNIAIERNDTKSIEIIKEIQE